MGKHVMNQPDLVSAAMSQTYAHRARAGRNVLIKQHRYGLIGVGMTTFYPRKR